MKVISRSAHLQSPFGHGRSCRRRQQGVEVEIAGRVTVIPSSLAVGAQALREPPAVQAEAAAGLRNPSLSPRHCSDSLRSQSRSQPAANLSTVRATTEEQGGEWGLHPARERDG